MFMFFIFDHTKINVLKIQLFFNKNLRKIQNEKVSLEKMKSDIIMFYYSPDLITVMST